MVVVIAIVVVVSSGSAMQLEGEDGNAHVLLLCVHAVVIALWTVLSVQSCCCHVVGHGSHDLG